jgi:hypothetical protein
LFKIARKVQNKYDDKDEVTVTVKRREERNKSDRLGRLMSYDLCLSKFCFTPRETNPSL